MYNKKLGVVLAAGLLAFSLPLSFSLSLMIAPGVRV